MNSLEPQAPYSSKTSPNLTLPSLRFKAKIADLQSEDQPSITIFKFSKKFQLDPLDWINSVLACSKDCGWSDQSAMGVLRVLLLDDENLLTIKDLRVLDSAVLHLLNKWYPIQHMTLYMSQIKQLKFTSITHPIDYYVAFDKLIQRINLCCGKNEQLRRCEIFGYFLQGLPQYLVKLILDKEIEDPLQAAEYLAKKKAKEMMYLAPGTVLSQQTPQPPANNQRSALKNQLPQRYCKYHKTSNHDTEECKYLKNQKKSKPSSFADKSTTTNPSAKTFMIQDALPPIQNLKLDCTLGESKKEVSALVDTGSTHNLICKKIADSLGLIYEPSLIPTVSGIANKLLPIKGQVNSTVTFTQIIHVCFKARFLVVDIDSELLILGNEFLITQYAKIDFSKLLITLDGKNIQFENAQGPMSPAVNNELVEKSSCHYINENKFLSLAIQTFGLNSTLGKIKDVQHHIKLTTNTLYKVKPYAVPMSLRGAFKAEIDRMLAEGIIRKSVSPFASPSFVIEKRNGSLRLIVDCRALNKITVTDPYPFPKLEEQLQDLSKAKIFTTIDLNSGYHQIDINEQDRYKTSFITPYGQFEYNVMCFGLTNAPRTFQRAMDNILGHLNFVKVYLDDVLIFSPDAETHYDNVKEVLTLLKTAGATINLEKSVFGRQEIEFLGHHVDCKGIAPLDRGITKLKNIQSPKTVKQLQRLLGLINWFRPFIRNLSSRISIITDLLQNKQSEEKIEWLPEHQIIINQILDELVQNPTLHHPQLGIPFEMYCDASDKGIGTVLIQTQKLIGLHSAKLTGAQLNYPVIEKECLAIISALKHWRSILHGQTIVVYTDHLNLTYIESFPLQRVQRWRLLLYEFNLEIKHIPGLNNQSADTLSRAFLAFATDLQKGADLERSVHEWHQRLCHPGEKKLHETLKTFLSHPQLRNAIKTVTSQCQECARSKKGKSNYGKLQGILMANHPFEIVHIDVFGPLDNKIIKEEKNVGKIYVLSMVDRFSRYTRFAPLYSLTGAETAKVFQETWIEQMPWPKTVTTDLGTNFQALEFRILLQKHKIRHSTNLPDNPTGNSIVERIHTQLGAMMRIAAGHSLSTILSTASFAINATYHRSLDLSPNEVVFGRNTFNSEKIIPRQQLQNLKEKMLLTKQKELQITNKKRLDTNFDNNSVYILRKRQSKFENPWQGPFPVLKTKPNRNLALVDLGYKNEWFNYKKLKPRGGGIVSCHSSTDT